MARYKRININDTARWNQVFTRQLANMFELARVITIGAYNRNESRGAHYKPEFPNRDDANFLKLRWQNLREKEMHQHSITRTLIFR